MDLANGNLSDCLWYCHIRPILTHSVEDRYVSDHAFVAVCTTLYCCCVWNGLFPWIPLHKRILLSASLLPNCSWGYSIAVWYLSLSPGAFHLLYLRSHRILYQKNRSLPSANMGRYGIFGSRSRPLYRLASTYVLGPDYHVSAHCRDRDRSQFSSPSNCATESSSAQRQRHCDSHFWFRSQHG